MSTMNSRRDFLKKSSLLIGGTAVLGGATLLTGCSSASATSTPNNELVEHPYGYDVIDADLAESVAYEGYFEAGCCYGVAKAMLEQLQGTIGFPFTAINPAIYKTGKEGYHIGTICGALAGAVNVISMCCDTDSAVEINKQLFTWYTSTELPLYRPEGLSDVQTVSPTINCSDSVSLFKKVANVEQADPIRRERCGAISGDVARKAVQLLNVHFGFEAAPVETPAPTMAPLADNEYIGEATGYEGPVKVKVTMDGDKIANIEVLEHAESMAGTSIIDIPKAILEAQSTEVDVVAKSTVTSEAIMAAVENALSQVK